jgi:hypothetical protein
MKLKRILNEIIKEGKQVGTVYHFTNLYAAIKILDTDLLKADSATRNIQGITVSTTRNKTFSKQRLGQSLQISGDDVGFELDGNSMSNR